VDYKKCYEKLCSSRKLLSRTKNEGIYYELHHILPKCLGGTNEKENLILLTFREHFIAHLLLTKMYEGETKRKMCFAFWRICHKNKSSERILSSTQYEYAKKLSTEAKIGQKRSEETKRKISIGHKGKIITEETRKKLSEINKGKKKNKHTKETKIKISIANKGKKRTIEQTKKMSERLLGIKQSEITKQKRKEKLINIPRSEEVKKKISIANDKNKKKVKCITNNITYESIAKASKELKLCTVQISNICNKKRKTPFKGYFFEFSK